MAIALGAEDRRPIVEWKIGRHDDRAQLITLAEDLEQKLGSGRRQGHITKFVDDQKLIGGELGLETQKPLLVARFHALMDKPGGGRKSDRHAALAGGKTESPGDVALARAAPNGGRYCQSNSISTVRDAPERG